MILNLKWVKLLSIFLCVLISFNVQAQAVSSKASKTTVGKSAGSSTAKRNAAFAARDKAKKDSVEAVLALAKKIALEYIAADSIKKVREAEAARTIQSKQGEKLKLSNEGLSKKEKKAIEREAKLTEAKRVKEDKEDEKARAKGKISKSSTKPQKFQTYAILPFDVKIEKNLQMKKTTPEMLHEQEISESSQYQNGVYQFLMKRKKDYAVSFQDIDDTNTILARAGLNWATIKSKTKGELCDLLKVEGIINGKFYRKELMDQQLGKGLNILAQQVAPMPMIKTGDADLSLTLFSAADQRVTWTYHNDDWNGMKDQNDITERLMQKAAKKFPFKK